MNIEITGRNYEVKKRIRTLLDGKLEKITKYFDDIIEIRCVLHVEKYRNLCEINVIGKEHDIKAGQEGETMEEAINLTMDHLKRQAQKNRAKIRDHRRKVKPSSALDSWTVQVLEPKKLRLTPKAGPRIIKTSNLPIRPMSIEQAAMMLDDSKNEFIVFRDLDTDKVTVIYRRRDSNFGMIAPEF